MEALWSRVLQDLCLYFSDGVMVHVSSLLVKAEQFKA